MIFTFKNPFCTSFWSDDLDFAGDLNVIRKVICDAYECHLQLRIIIFTARILDRSFLLVQPRAVICFAIG